MILFDNYKLELKIKGNSIAIKLIMLTPYVNTQKLLHTYSYFKNNLPTILQSDCYNAENLPFNIEIANTELGHLFEHILLEKLCEEKILHGQNEATFSGNTSWNWKKDPYGVFNIFVEIDNSDLNLINNSLLKTCAIFSAFLSNKNVNQKFVNKLLMNSPMEQMTP